MRIKSNNDIILVFTTMIAFYKQYGLYRTSHTLVPWNNHPQYQKFSKSTRYTTQDHSILSARTKIGRICSNNKCTVFKSQIDTQQTLCPLFTTVQQTTNNMTNSIHTTLPPSIIFKGTKIDFNFQKLVPFAAFHYAKRVDNKYQSHNQTIFRIFDDQSRFFDITNQSVLEFWKQHQALVLSKILS